ncbi:glyoxalase/bleomycin resistance protein/dioxygenase superfamily protein [Novosphingobium sp. ST904]|nr:glyoxalase/bleomycin resistance protein/dioxygenase superfamily protein [Novosphingobium sp. ST904]
MTSKIGESFHSFELKVEDGPAASEAIRGAGGVVASDYGFFFFVKPETTGGVLLEVCSSTMPNDPYDRPGGWGPGVGTGHASSVLQLDHIACVTGEIDKAVDFFTSVINGRIIEDKTTSLPQRGRRVLLGIGDIQVAFIQPDDTQQGPLGAFLNKPQNGIYALVWRIADEQLARQHFEKRNLRMTEVACVSAGFAIDPADFFGGRHEFVTANS